jgi:hypothetical protein
MEPPGLVTAKSRWEKGRGGIRDAMSSLVSFSGAYETRRKQLSGPTDGRDVVAALAARFLLYHPVEGSILG